MRVFGDPKHFAIYPNIMVSGWGGGGNCKIVRKIPYEMVSHLKVLIKQYVKHKPEVFD